MNILNKEKILEQAKAFADEGKFDRAAREYEKILLADPSDLRVKLKLAELHTKRKQINDAIRIYREVADAYVAEGFYLKAVTVCKNILRINPTLSKVNEKLAELYEKMGLSSDAIRQYDILAQSCDQKGDTECTIEARKRIVEISGGDFNARVRLAELYQREGRMDDALGEYEECAKTMEKAGGDRKKLADIYEKIVAHKPDRHDLLRKLIAIYDSLGDVAMALKTMERGGEMIEKDIDLLALQALFMAHQRQTEAARTKFIMLADIRKEAGDIDKALDAYCEILAMLPDEDDRLKERVEALKEGAMPGLVKEAQKRREERERAEAHEEHERDATKAEEKTAVKSQSRSESQSKSKSASRPQPAPQPEPPPKPLRPKGEAFAAFDLGQVLKGAGLVDEARVEFEKALFICEAHIKTGVASADIEECASKSRAELAISGEMTGGPVKRVDIPVEEEAEPPKEPPRAEGTRLLRTPAKPKTKKKISYI